MAAYKIRFHKLSDSHRWIEHLSHFGGMSFTVKRVNGLWEVDFEHPKFTGEVSLHPEGVYLSSPQTKQIYTRTGRIDVPEWERLVRFDGSVSEVVRKSSH